MRGESVTRVRRFATLRSALAVAMLAVPLSAVGRDAVGASIASNEPSTAATALAFLDAKGHATTTLDLAAQGVTQVPMVMVNSGRIPSSDEPATLEVSLPAGVSVASIDSYDSTTRKPTPASWHCTLHGAIDRCQLVDRSTGRGISVQPKSYLLAIMSLSATAPASNASAMVLGVSGHLGGATSGTASLRLSPGSGAAAVSYTHLTLPTNREV